MTERSTYARLSIPVRCHQMELPASYLSRLSKANGVPAPWLARMAAAQRSRAGRSDEVGTIIEELSGVPTARFMNFHEAASVGMGDLLRPPFDRQRLSRVACLACTSGEHVTTYDHIRFSFCLRHGTWLGSGATQRFAAAEPAFITAERRARRLAATGTITQGMFESAWELVRNNVYMLGNSHWGQRLEAVRETPGFIREVDDRLAFFPETVRVLDVISRPKFISGVSAGRRDCINRRNYLNRAFNWVPGERWVLVEGIDRLRSRAAA